MSLFTIAYEYLTACSISVSKEYFEKKLRSHPNYPALASLTDTLDELELEEGYVALKGTPTNIESFSFPFLAQTPKAVGGFEIVPSFEYYEKNKTAFLNRWEGVALMIAPGQKVNNKENLQYLGREKKNRRLLTAILISAIILFLGLLLVNFTPIAFSFSLLNMMGVGICSLIIVHKMGSENKLTRQLCSKDKDHGCDLVLNSKVSKIGKEYHLGDAGLVYFTGLLIFTILSSLTIQPSKALLPLTLVSIAAFFATFFSLYYQWKVVKAWCKMCLLIILVVWLQTIVLSTNFILYATSQSLFESFNVLTVLLCFSLASIWFLIKPYFEKSKKNDAVEIELLKWKRNPDIFNSLLFNRSGSKTDLTIRLNPAFIGSKRAPVQLTIVSNPFCKPCSAAHESLHDLYKRNSESVSINVIFLVKKASDLEDRRVVAVKEIVNAILTYNNNAPEVLQNWFNSMDIATFKQLYPQTSSNSDSIPILEGYQSWLEKNYVPHTPLIYLNGYLLPQQYTLKDVESFIPEMSYTILNQTKIQPNNETKLNISR
ncbi:MAG TPA: vitamin K epoxide reductase family protein [Niabella sp.]|nr:vitamin K epoxide reductase family protein [Niabella sp.]